jgi:hypothetical protein
MTDQVTEALIGRLQPLFYFIGLFVVLGFVSFGGTILGWYFKARNKKEDTITQSLSANTIAIARLEAKLDIFIEKHDKDLRNLGNKIKNLEV